MTPVRNFHGEDAPYVKNLKWYSTFGFLTGAILGFADPITDVFTLVEFYRENDMIWFRLGLTFMLVPCFVFTLISCLTVDNCDDACEKCSHCVLSFTPFSPAWASLKAFILCLVNFNNLWHDVGVDCEDRSVDEVNRSLWNLKLAQFTEAVTESVPQFIIQLYVANVQEQPVKIIQIISLSVSCLSIVWGFTAADGNLHGAQIEVKIKHKVLFFAVNLFLLTSRLLAICYFTMVLRLWIILVLVSHSIIVAWDDFCLVWREGNDDDWKWWWFFILFHWIRDDLSAPVHYLRDNMGEQRKRLKTVLWLSQSLYVVENFAMILVFYCLSKFSNTWYALPVTVYVCTATILCASIRLIHFSFLLKPSQVSPEPSDP